MLNRTAAASSDRSSRPRIGGCQGRRRRRLGRGRGRGGGAPPRGKSADAASGRGSPVALSRPQSAPHSGTSPQATTPPSAARCSCCRCSCCRPRRNWAAGEHTFSARSDTTRCAVTAHSSVPAHLHAVSARYRTAYMCNVMRLAVTQEPADLPQHPRAAAFSWYLFYFLFHWPRVLCRRACTSRKRAGISPYGRRPAERTRRRRNGRGGPRGSLRARCGLHRSGKPNSVFRRSWLGALANRPALQLVQPPVTRDVSRSTPLQADSRGVATAEDPGRPWSFSCHTRSAESERSALEAPKIREDPLDRQEPPERRKAPTAAAPVAALLGGRRGEGRRRVHGRGARQR